ncbi:MAG TPA: DUF1236 domain-containing protein [Bradyrhizobium sp.]|jgi:hypothetical protein|uniref:DUF1236 domain-containing protein n=1 Tax=Bradyrhizobium sp. TaxID=376 RepID=UPI002C38EAD0|nr:DUF1236 domain-containing protein [Bradyrhizobium sp.]HTB02785.1 DUF1236 domain-containing protein [Bradyrhizobium sp.]
MTNRFMISVAAAALIAGTVAANAQGMGREGSPGAAVQQSAPAAGGAAAPSHESTEPAKPSSGMKSTQTEQKPPMAGKNQRAEENMPGAKPKGMSSESDKGGAKDMKAEGREDRTGNMKAEGREDRTGNMKAEGREDRMNAESKGAETKSQTTVGQAGAGAKLSTEQRTRITSVIREQHVAPVEHVDFAISVGTRVPHDVRFYPLPTEVVTIYPEWRGYEFILVNDQIVVVDPRTFEIVAVIEA